MLPQGASSLYLAFPPEQANALRASRAAAAASMAARASDLAVSPSPDVVCMVIGCQQEGNDNDGPSESPVEPNHCTNGGGRTGGDSPLLEEVTAAAGMPEASAEPMTGAPRRSHSSLHPPAARLLPLHPIVAKRREMMNRRSATTLSPFSLDAEKAPTLLLAVRPT